MTPINVYFGSEVLGEMPHDMAFYQCLRCLLHQKQSSKKEIILILEIMIYNCQVQIGLFLKIDLATGNHVSKYHL